MESHGNFDFYFGIAALDKPYNQRLLKVYIPDLYPFYQDELTDTTVEETITINSIDGKETIKVNTSNVITAEYLDFDANREFPPDIRKGEYVFILHYRDNDIFYWLPLNYNKNLRRLEIYRIAISNDINIKKDLNEDNTYYFEIDTLHKKSIILRTSKSDKEEFRYIIHIDGKNSEITISDDDDNYILLQSKIPRIKLHNKNNSFIDINQDDIFLNAPRDIRLNVGRMLYINSESIAIDNSNAVVINTDNIGISANNGVISAGTIGLDGNVKISGALVANTVRSSSYGTGSVGSMYTAPSANTDIYQGSTTTPSNTPDNDDSSGTMRHACAWEQIKPALDIIASCLSEVDNKIGIGCSYSSISSLANDSIMEKNKGE